MVREDGHCVWPNLDSDERQRIQEANQIFLRLRKNLHDRDERFKERDIEEATKGARWLREVVERYPNDLEAAYEARSSRPGCPRKTKRTSKRGRSKREVSPRSSGAIYVNWRKPLSVKGSNPAARR